MRQGRCCRFFGVSRNRPGRFVATLGLDRVAKVPGWMTRVRGIGSFRGMSIPAELQKVVRRFERAPKDLRVQALLQYSQRVPPLPERFSEDRESLEQVHECQSPFFLASEVDEAGRVHLFFDAPPESPTVRGFAGILYDGLEGQPAEAVLAVPPAGATSGKPASSQSVG